MKRFISLLLTFIFITSCFCTVVFADVQPAVYEGLASKGDNHFAGMDSSSKALFGKSSGEVTYSYSGTGNKNGKFLMENPIIPNPGDKVKLSYQIAWEKYDANKSIIDFGMQGTGTYADGTEVNLAYNNACIRMWLDTSYLGSTSTSGKYSKITNAVKTPCNSWVTVDFLYEIGSSSNGGSPTKLSIYIDGTSVLNSYNYNINSKAIYDIKSISGMALGLYNVGYTVPFYFGDMTITHYPAAYTGLVVETTPWSGSSDLAKNFVANTDGSLVLKKADLKESDIEAASSNGWTFSYVDDAKDNIIKNGYIVMTKGDATYYKKVTATDRSFVNKMDMSSVTIGTYSIGNIRRLTDFEVNNSVLSSAEKSETSNKYLRLDFNPPSDNKHNAIRYKTDSISAKEYYTNMAETGRVAYEFSYLVPDTIAERPLDVFIHTNVTPSETSGASLTSMGTRQYALRIENNSGGIIIPSENKDMKRATGYPIQSILPNEWHKFTFILDTDKDTMEVYHNGILAFTQEFEDLKNVSFMDVGYNKFGNTEKISNLSMCIDDLSFSYVSDDWKPSRVTIEPADPSVIIDDSLSIIRGNISSQAELDSALKSSDVYTYKYADGKVKAYDATMENIRTFLVVPADDDIIINGFDTKGFENNETGVKSKEVYVTNISDKSDVKIALILASYGINGNLVSIDTCNYDNFYPRSTLKLQANIEVTELEPVKEIKAFLFTDMDTIKPIRPSVSNIKN